MDTAISKRRVSSIPNALPMEPAMPPETASRRGSLNIKIYKESPSIFGYDLQRLGLKGFIAYISQEFTANTLYSPDQFTPDYIINDNKKNGNTFNVTRIVKVDLFGNIEKSILELPIN